MKKLYLVGTHHLDLKGPERLERFLEFVRPDTIGLESTVENLERRLKDHEDWQNQRVVVQEALLELYGAEGSKKIDRWLNMLGYECWVSAKHAQKNSGVRLVNCEELQRGEFREIVKTVFGEMIDNQGEATPNFADDVSKCDFIEVQKLTDASYQNNSTLALQKDPTEFRRLLPDRDEKIERKIREAFANSENTMVYVGGTLHFFGDYPNLYERLSDLSPSRLKLVDIDQF